MTLQLINPTLNIKFFIQTFLRWNFHICCTSVNTKLHMFNVCVHTVCVRRDRSPQQNCPNVRGWGGILSSPQLTLFPTIRLWDHGRCDANGIVCSLHPTQPKVYITYTVLNIYSLFTCTVQHNRFFTSISTVQYLQYT